MAGDCLVDSLLQPLGLSHMMVGAAMDQATANLAPFDARYLYLSGGLFDGAEPCPSCASGCTTGGQSCANSAGGCAWWGCWQWDADPNGPGQYAVNLLEECSAATYNSSPHPQIPWFTYYEILQASGLNEGTEEVAAINDTAFLHRYLADWRFLLQRIGNRQALLHIEPDFWGYGEQLNPDPHAVPAAVAAANPTDCGAMESSLAGFGRCMIHMVRLYAPNAKVSLHASGWGTNMDALSNSDSGFDVAAEAEKLADWLKQAGATDGDFIVADMSDRDAGYYQAHGRDSWWDDTNATLPDFAQAFTWSKALAERLGKPVVWWQIPVGNMSLPDTYQQYRDNRVDYLFAHPAEIVAAHGAGILFGAGNGETTTPETDGGNLVARVVAYGASGGQQPCVAH